MMARCFILAIIFALISMVSSQDVRCLGSCTCNLQSLTVNCSDSKLTEIPFGIPENTKVIDLSKNLIPQVKESDFSDTNNLEEIYLSENKIKNIDTLTFTNLKYLKTLDLSYNSVKLSGGCFQEENLSIEELNLYGNALGNLLPGQFSGLSNLKSLNLGFNGMNNIVTKTFTGLTRLSKLTLKENFFYSIILPGLDDIKTSLTTLDMTYNQRLSELKSEDGLVLELPVLENLILIGCGFRSIKNESFSGMPILRAIDLTYNRFLNALSPNSFVGLDYLKTIVLSYTGIVVFPYLAFVPVSVSLKEIQLDNVYIRSITPNPLLDEDYLSNLEVLSLNTNLIERISNDSFFQHLKSLKKLDLSRTKLSEIPTEALSYLYSLETLVYDGNVIYELNIGDIPHLEHLKEIHISGSSNLQNISEDFFKTISASLNYIDISNNNLDTPAVSWFQGNQLSTVLLSNNPWNCDCDITDFKQWQTTEEHRNIENMEELECYLPRPLRGKSLSQVDSNYLTCQEQECPSTCICMEVDSGYIAQYSVRNVKNKWREYLKNKNYNISFFETNIPGYTAAVNKVTTQTAYYVDCSSSKLADIPPIPKESTFAILMNNQFKSLKFSDFSFLFDLKGLILSNNMIGDIENGTFVSLYNLIKLDLSSNQLTEIQNEFFLNLTSLQELHLAYNMINQIGNLSFSTLKQLRVLELSSNDIRYINKEIFRDLVSLEYLGIADNYLINGVSPDAFNGLLNLWAITITGSHINNVEKYWFINNVKLEVVDLRENLFTEIQPEFLLSETLVTLYLEDGNIQFINDSAFSMLPNMRTLRMQGNNIKKILHTAFKLNEQYSETGKSQLVSVDLAYNSITDIPVDSFWHLYNVLFLRLDNNPITSLPVASDYSYDYNHEFDPYMPYLETLYLGYTPISSIPLDSFVARVFYIKTLDISFCQFEELPYDFLAVMQSLTSLVADGNKITDISTALPDALSQLEYFRLGETGVLRNLSRSTFINTQFLKEIILSNGKIEVLPIDIFDGLNKLEVLDLSGNNLITPYTEWFTAFQPSTFRRVLLESNPWICDCETLPYRNWLEHGADGLTAYQLDIICDSPQNVKSWYITKIRGQLIDKTCNLSTERTITTTKVLTTDKRTSTLTTTDGSLRMQLNTLFLVIEFYILTLMLYN